MTDNEMEAESSPQLSCTAKRRQVQILILASSAGLVVRGTKSSGRSGKRVAFRTGRSAFKGEEGL